MTRRTVNGFSPDLSELEAVYASSWLNNILLEMST